MKRLYICNKKECIHWHYNSPIHGNSGCYHSHPHEWNEFCLRRHANECPLQCTEVFDLSIPKEEFRI